ncbi:MAG: hypothetical protein HY731_12920, partial [Candidatus Tectomicrobia bacterium]|nr:hypothetical protein [Candidatus Tectomicrobia bacterium]
MQFGVSYFGVRNPTHFLQDLLDIKASGFDYIIFTFSEDDQKHYKDTMKECFDLTHREGLRVWVDPWGVGGVFGGEAFTFIGAWERDAQQVLSNGEKIPVLCPNSSLLIEHLKKWIDTASEIGGDVTFWDEPHFFITRGTQRDQGIWSCRCQECQRLFQERYGTVMPLVQDEWIKAFQADSLLRFLTTLTDYAHERGMQNALCLLPDYEQIGNLPEIWDRFGQISSLDILGTDPYWVIHKQPLEHVRVFARGVRKVTDQYKKGHQMWIQAFRIPAGEEENLVKEIEILIEEGIENIAIWSYL